MGCSNNLTGIVNFITTLLSIPIIAVGIWLAHKHNTDCVRFLQWPVIILGVFILVVSLAGFVGSCWRISWLLWVYLFVMFLLIFLLFVFTIFAFVVTNKGAGQAVSGKGYKEYRLGDYSNWLQNRVNNPTYWNDIKSCLSDGKFCNGLDAAYPTQAAFNSASLTPIEVFFSPKRSCQCVCERESERSKRDVCCQPCFGSFMFRETCQQIPSEFGGKCRPGLPCVRCFVRP